MYDVFNPDLFCSQKLNSEKIPGLIRTDGIFPKISIEPHPYKYKFVEIGFLVPETNFFLQPSRLNIVIENQKQIKP